MPPLYRFENSVEAFNVTPAHALHKVICKLTESDVDRGPRLVCIIGEKPLPTLLE